MYGGDISHILRRLAILLILFVVYQAWLKPTYLALPPSRHTDTAASLVSPNSNPSMGQEFASAEVPPARLVNLGHAPTSQLNLIHDELERGYILQAESSLRMLPNKMMAKERVRQYVAALWNNLGVQQEKFGGIALSVMVFKKAVELDPSNPIAHLNLTRAYWGLRDPALTPEFLQKVILLAPKDLLPHLALADLLIDQGDVTLASRHLKEVAPRAAIDPNLQSYVRRLTARIELAASSNQRSLTIAEQALRTDAPGPATSPPPRADIGTARAPATQPVTPSVPVGLTPSEGPTRQPAPREPTHFTVRFRGDEDQAAWEHMRAILEYAYQEISQKFGHVPSAPITVVLHTKEQFTNTAMSPEWADSLFDEVSGSIHIPVQGALDDLALLSRVLRHEFVHALLRDKMEARLTALPTWLIEGLAIQLAEDPWPDLFDAKKTDLKLIPLTSLQGRWSNLPNDSRSVAYLEADLAVQNLVEQYSIFKVRQVMNSLKTGQPLSAAMQDKLSLSYEQFQLQWAESFSAKLKPGKS